MSPSREEVVQPKKMILDHGASMIPEDIDGAEGKLRNDARQSGAKSPAVGNGSDWVVGRWMGDNEHNSESSWPARYKSTSCINRRSHSLPPARR